MASSIQDLEFLDLSDVDEAERDHLQQVLFTITPNLELPWELEDELQCSSDDFEQTPFAAEPANAVELVPPISALECSSGNIVATTTTNTPSHVSGAGDAGYTSENAQVPILSVPPSVSSSVAPSTQPVITTMYQMVGHAGVPLSNVYVGNVTANVNVHSFVGPPLAPFTPHLSQQQVFPSGDVPVPHEPTNSPSTGRNGMGQRRPRGSKPGSKRLDGGHFGTRTSASGHSHEVLQSVVESPTGPPPLQSYNMIPVPSMHHPHHAYHQQSFYPSPTQPPHGAPPHITQHPTAQHATGTPIFLQSVPLFHPSMYNTYHPPQPAAGGPIVYSPSPGLVAAAVSTTEQSSEATYQVDDEPTVRMVPEGQETEISVHEPVLPPMYQEETPPVKSCVNSDAKLTGYIRQDSDTESCTLASTVVVNNSNIVSNTPLPSEKFKAETKDPDSEGSNGKVKYKEPEPEKKFANGNLAAADKPREKADATRHLKTVASEPIMNAEKRESERASVSPKVDMNQHDIKLSDGFSSSTKTSPSGDSNFTHSGSSSKTSPPCTAPFGRHLGAANDAAVPTTPVTPNVRERTWASLFDKNSNDGPMILAVGGSAANAKPLAAVRPFTNAVPVIPGSGDVSRKVSEMAVPGEVTRGFPHLGHCELPPPLMADDPHLYGLGEFLSKYQLDHKAISLQPRGLTNRSNWCYINSTLQALLACPPFYNLIKSIIIPSGRSNKSSTPIIDSMVRFVNEFSPLSAASRVNRKEKAQRKDETIEVQAGAAFEPSYIYKMLSNIQSDTFKVEGRQEDAEEFFSCLLNALNDEMLELIKLVKDTSAEGNLSNGDVANGDAAHQGYEEDDTEWKVMGRKNKGSITRRAEFERTPVSDIFRGQLRSRVQRAGDHSDNVQPFFTLQLDIEKAQSVKEALDLLVGRDQLEGVTCSRTNQEVEAWQQVTLEELPLVLVLHLKWFNYKKDGCSKIVKTVEFPIELKVDGKLMSQYNKYNTKQKQYKLFAVVYHDGKEATKGHYVTDVYHVGYGGWVRYDDSSVKAIQENQMLHPRGSRVPYLLYYRRCDTIGSASATPDKSR